MNKENNKLVLKACPFCGSEDVSLFWKTSEYGGFHIVKCADCMASTGIVPVGKFTSKVKSAEKAVAMWNRRVGDAE